jgi:hypothetical protein
MASKVLLKVFTYWRLFNGLWQLFHKRKQHTRSPQKKEARREGWTFTTLFDWKQVQLTQLPKIRSIKLCVLILYME